MSFNQDYTEHLIVQKLLGRISLKEDEELKLLIQINESAKNLWEELNEAYAIYEAGVFSQNLREKQAWDIVSSQLTPSQPVIKKSGELSFLTRKRAILMAAILFVATVAGGLLIYNHNNNTTPSKNSFTANPNNGVILKMANGKTIDIPESQENMSVDRQTGAAITLTDGSVVADANKEGFNKEEFNTLYVPAGKDYHLVLSDGSEVWLNAESELKFPLTFTRETRTVSIKGEAYFKIARGSKKPFIVKTPFMDVKVLGTEFNVKCYENEPAKTSLVTGKVALQALNGKDTVLIPGKEAMITENGKFQISDFDEDVALSWMKGVYVFNNLELRHLQSVIKRWYDMEVIIAEETVADQRFTGAIHKNKPIDELLNSLTKSSDIQYKIRNRQIVFHLR